MNSIEVDPWIRDKVSALETYRVDGTLYTIPFVVAKDLTLTKSKEKYMLECRRLPKKYKAMFEDKGSTAVHLTKPIELGRKPVCYMKESSSQHMSTILEGVEHANFRFEKADVLVTNETLNTIAGAVFQQEKSWRLRAFVENVQGKAMIVLCADDLNEEFVLLESTNFDKERSESLSFAQEFCDREKNSNANPHLHGSLAVLSTIRTTDLSSVQMVVVGEVEMVAGQQAVNTVVRNGIGRSNRIIFGPDEERICDYIWSRSFWLGLTDCVIGSRQSDEDNVHVAQRYSLVDFYRQHRHRNNKLADVATNCVARVLVRLREAVQSDPRANWIVEYEGRGEDEELDNVRISKAEESYSFWLIREKFYMQKVEMMQKYNPKMKVERQRKYPKNYCAIP